MTPPPDFGRLQRSPPSWDTQRPQRIAVIGDFGSAASAGKAWPVRFDTLDEVLARFRVQAADEAIVALDDFHPDSLLRASGPASADALRDRLHRPAFQQVESAWRGVDFLLRRLDRRVEVHLIDMPAGTLAADLSPAADLGDSQLYRLLVDQPAQQAGGGYAFIAALHRFDATPAHAELLGRAARIASHAGAAFITGLAPDSLLDREEPPPGPVRDAFAALRALPAASWLGLMAPRFLLRHPYGRRSDPIDSFAFEEFTPQRGLRGMLWGHPALLALCVLARPGSTLVVGDLPFHHFVDADGDSTALPCTERLLDTDAAGRLRAWGVNAVLAHRGEALVRLAGLQAINGDGLAAAAGKVAQGADLSVVVGTPAGESKVGEAWTPAVRTAVVDAAVTEAAPAPPPEAEPAAEAPAAMAEMAAAAPAPADPAMDPELKALLDSLN